MKCVQTVNNVLRLNEQEAAEMVREGSGRYATRLAWKTANPAEHQANVAREQQNARAALARKEAKKKQLEAGN